MLQLIILILVIFLVYSTPVLINNYIVERNAKNSNKGVFLGKLNKTLLTDNEYRFYIKLKEITDKNGYLLFTKVRLADIISTTNYSDFNKIRSKHIDFLICNYKTEFIKFIELDDNSHLRKKNKQNDNVKNDIFSTLDVEIYRIKVNEEKEKLQELEQLLKSLNS